MNGVEAQKESYSWYFKCLFVDYSTKLFPSTPKIGKFQTSWNVFLLLTAFYCAFAYDENDPQKQSYTAVDPSNDDQRSCWERHKLAKNISFTFTDKNLSRSRDISRDDILAPSSMSRAWK